MDKRIIFISLQEVILFVRGYSDVQTLERSQVALLSTFLLARQQEQWKLVKNETIFLWKWSDLDTYI